MTTYPLPNFDTPVDRSGSNSQKWDAYSDPNIISGWLADMDFQAPMAILDDIRKGLDHGVLGYTVIPQELVDVFIKRMRDLHNWHIEREWIVWLPGLVPALYATARAIGEPGDGVMINSPAYWHFLAAPKYAGRVLQDVPLVSDSSGYYRFDFDAMRSARDKRTKLFILCNPHNPTGRVFSKDELIELAEFCTEHGIVICSDEIHCDLILDSSKRHISIATLGDEIAKNTITLLAPSKTFNIPGLGCSCAVIPDRELRAKFVDRTGKALPSVNVFGGRAALIAYRDCEEWRLELIKYLRANHEYCLREFNSIPGLSMAPLEATYLAWIDATKTGIKDIESHLKNFGVGVAGGHRFGGDPRYFRLTLGTQRARLEDIVMRVREGVAV
jgi:cystathionine beta-lyase